MEHIELMKQILERIYGKEKGEDALARLLPLVSCFSPQEKKDQEYFSQKDIILITYGDSLITEGGESPLKTLKNFADENFNNIFSTIHILPFYPFSSDDGFSVIDFFAVNPELGTWDDVNGLGENFKLMFDLVLNHISSKSDWFRRYLEEEEGYKELAIEADPTVDLSEVIRPRSLPLLTEYKKGSGKPAHIWTTFSADQIDLNFKSLDVLEKMIEALLYYVKQGAKIIRLDAIAYLWKDIGTNCVHLSQTHDVVKLFRKIFDIVAPDAMILTETNVPHDENVSYFGDGKNEAQMVYNFTLPPLLFYTFIKSDTTVLSNWAKGLELDSDDTTFFNFTSSHDGIGVRPLEGILPADEIEKMIDVVKENGGNVSYKQNSDGSESPYELNITYVDALLNKKVENDEYHEKRFLASQAIALSLPGVPAVYIHSILGSRNWEEGVEQTKRARTINREKLLVHDVLSEHKDPESFRSKIFYPYIELIKLRKQQPAFHPNSLFKVLDVGPGVFAIKRFCTKQNLISLTNVTNDPVTVILAGNVPTFMKDLVTGDNIITNKVLLGPCQYVWLSNN